MLIAIMICYCMFVFLSQSHNMSDTRRCYCWYCCDVWYLLLVFFFFFSAVASRFSATLLLLLLLRFACGVFYICYLYLVKGLQFAMYTFSSLCISINFKQLKIPLYDFVAMFGRCYVILEIECNANEKHLNESFLLFFFFLSIRLF